LGGWRPDGATTRASSTPQEKDPAPYRRKTMTQVTQALILAGGQATRTRPYTDDAPKAMVPVAGTSIIGYQLRLPACPVRPGTPGQAAGLPRDPGHDHHGTDVRVRHPGHSDRVRRSGVLHSVRGWGRVLLQDDEARLRPAQPVPGEILGAGPLPDQQCSPPLSVPAPTLGTSRCWRSALSHGL
jgi:hypothetical protein